MNIEFTVEEYFNELQLMESQYGQEEDLYPWIYMLLQMVECRKKNILDKQYNPLSIRDVHKAQSVSKPNDKSDESDKKLYAIKKALTEKHGVPDLAILDIQGKNLNFLGCIEIKKCPSFVELMNESLFLIKEGVFPKNKSVEFEKYKISYIANVKNIKSPPIELEPENIDKKIIPLIEKDLSKFNEYINSTDNYTITPNYKYPYNYYYEIEFSPKQILHYKKLYNELKSKLSIQLSINNQIENISFSRKIEPSSWTWEPIYDWPDEIEIIKHLEKFKKVLYTNGLTFYFLMLDENGTMINVKKLADLRYIYKTYCDYYQKHYQEHLPFETMPHADRLSAACEWDRLIAGLAAIDWHQEPITSITED